MGKSMSHETLLPIEGLDNSPMLSSKYWKNNTVMRWGEDNLEDIQGGNGAGCIFIRSADRSIYPESAGALGEHSYVIARSIFNVQLYGFGGIGLRGVPLNSAWDICERSWKCITIIVTQITRHGPGGSRAVLLFMTAAELPVLHRNCGVTSQCRRPLYDGLRSAPLPAGSVIWDL